MTIKSLKLTNFRNFARYDLEPGKITILIGPNGVGKTNLLEAIYILSVCRSYRTRRDQEVIKWADSGLHSKAHEKTSPNPSLLRRGGDAPNFSPLQGEIQRGGLDTARVSAEIESDSGDKLSLALAQTGDKKIAFVGEKQVPVSLVVGTLPTVIFVPEIMDLPEASPAKRRRSFDILLAQIEPRYTQTLLKYNQILKARNKLLFGISTGRNKENELDFWDKQLVELGTTILKTRIKEAEELNKHVITCYNKINNGKKEKEKRKLGFKYLSCVSDIDRFEEELIGSRDQELRYGNTIIGPHRDDWQMKLDNVDVRMAASRGETRAALLALKMAEMEILRTRRNEMPILLLDDVFAELDRHHSESLLEFFGGGSSYTLSASRRASISSPQVFITATDAEYIPEKIRSQAKIIEIGIH